MGSFDAHHHHHYQYARSKTNCPGCTKAYYTEHDNFCWNCGKKRDKNGIEVVKISPEEIYGGPPVDIHYHCAYCGYDWTASNWYPSKFCPNCGKPCSANQSAVPNDNNNREFCLKSNTGGQIIHLTENITNYLGRDFSCDIIFNDPTVSRKHCKIHTRKNGLFIMDSGSLNGTYINNDRIEANCYYALYEGDIIKMGNQILEVVALEKTVSSRSGNYLFSMQTIYGPPPAR